jgi:hypothetical protein
MVTPEVNMPQIHSSPIPSAPKIEEPFVHAPILTEQEKEEGWTLERVGRRYIKVLGTERMRRALTEGYPKK